MAWSEPRAVSYLTESDMSTLRNQLKEFRDQR